MSNSPVGTAAGEAISTPVVETPATDVNPRSSGTTIAITPGQAD
jgi:hypothetical protein